MDLQQKGLTCPTPIFRCPFFSSQNQNPRIWKTASDDALQAKMLTMTKSEEESLLSFQSYFTALAYTALAIEPSNQGN